MEFINELIACCGLNCATCDARIATISNDYSLRESTAAKWRIEYNSPDITADLIHCTGCRIKGEKVSHCNECKIRKCVNAKGFSTCADCIEMENCSTVGWLFEYVPEAKINLSVLKSS
ncbi:MAG TPA: DUF3795 domain-containing protein [Bacteroidales bacterium]|nr:DUF3795 domain-containing protein [Bacteroidales bacterium]